MSLTPDPLFLALQAAIAGRYSLERELGRGGMGIVYLARDVRLDRPVALKLLPPDRAAMTGVRDRFVHEARMAARLAHPNIVPIHAVEEIDDFVFYAMRFVDGETLGDRLRRLGRLSPRESAGILRDTAYALAYAHAQGVIHRDIKPDNILLEADGGRALVTDFGIAHLANRPDASGRVVGTPEYLAPEQATGEPVDARSDLYALGAVGFHCLAGRPPFEGDVQALLAQHVTRPAPLLHDVAPDAPPMLCAAIDLALAKLPADRFASAEDMAEAIAPSIALTGELPVPVRVWVERGRELKAMYVIWSCFFFGMGTFAYVAAAVNAVWSFQALAIMAMCAAATVAPWLGHGLWRIHQTRRAFEGGVTFADLRHGLDVAVERRDEELRYEHSRPIHWLPRLVRFATYTALAGAIASLAGGVFAKGAIHDFALYFQLFAGFTVLTGGGALFGLVFPGRRLGVKDSASRFSRWLWESPLGHAVARIAAIGLPASRNNWAAWRPTETALGSVTETLFAALPQRERAVLADLPQVVARLEREAMQAREHLDRGEAGPWGDRLERAVAAIETLRVGLMRMTAGHTAATSVTADLDAARALSVQIDYLVAGAAEVASLLDEVPGSRQSSTQPSPRNAAPSTSLG